jgi:hypothetical protein
LNTVAMSMIDNELVKFRSINLTGSRTALRHVR